MKKARSTSGVDLHLEVAGSRLRASLEAALRDAVRAGRLPGGTKLPSSRALAEDLGLSRNTVTEAYAQLVAEGWLVAALGSGTYVADLPEPGMSQAGKEGARLSVRHDLRPGTPDVSSFPRAGWLGAMRRALQEAPDTALGYGDPRGVLELREALAGYLSRARGVVADPANVVVCSGFTAGLWLACRALRSGGASAVALEEYGHDVNGRVVAEAGLATRYLGVDEQGVVVEQLSYEPTVGGAVVTPAHQFPLGVVLSSKRRGCLIEWANATDGVVIEDDYDGEFRYDRQPVGALQALCPHRVIYAGTASKTLAPGLRLAWLVVPEQLLEQVIAAKVVMHRQTSTVDQLALAAFINNGAYDRHIRARRNAYRRRRDSLVEMANRLPDRARVTGIAAGLQAVLQLPAYCKEDEVVSLARERGLMLEGLSAYEASSTTKRPPSLVLGYAGVPEHSYTAAIEELSTVLREAISRNSKA